MNTEKWKKIDELFNSALEVDADKRRAFIEELTDDQEIAAEVERLIAAHESAGSFIDNPLADKALKVISNKDSLTPKDNKGPYSPRRVGRFAVISTIGKGGMGEVFRARDESLERDVAIKILPTEFTSDTSRVSRFIREAKAASALNHPNILTIYEIGEFDGTHFIASEFVKGQTLTTFLTQKDLTLKEVLDLAKQIVSALHVAHEAGIIHRDIKPDNIMVRNDGIVKVLDFGLAKLTERKEEDNSGGLPASPSHNISTTPGLIMGTPNYMSPEQARGISIDFRSDIFSVGVLLYEIFAGKLPFRGETVSDTIAAVLTKEPEPLKHIPQVLAGIIERCLQKDRDKRYQTAKNLLEDIEDFSDSLQIQMRLERSLTPEIEEAKTQVLKRTTIDENVEQATPTNTRRGFSKRSYIAAAIAVVIFSIAGILIYQNLSSSKQVRSIAVLPFVNESGNRDVEYLSDGMTETLIRRLSSLPNLDVKARSSVFRYKGREPDVRKISLELDAQAILMGSFSQRDDQIALNLELVDAATLSVIWTEQYIRRQTDLVSLQSDVARDVSARLKNAISGEERTKITDNGTTNSDAYQAYLRGRYFLAKGTFEAPQEALPYFQEAVARDPNFAQAYAGLADCYALLGTVITSKMKPSEALPKARLAAQKALEINPNLSEAYVSLAWIKYRYDWDWEGAESDFKKAVEIDPKNAQAHQWFGEFLATLRRDEEAIEKLRRARDLEPFNMLMNWNYAKVFLDFSRYDEAIFEAKKLVEMDKTFFRSYRVLFQSYSAKGMYPEAFEYFLTSRELSKDTPQRLEEYRKIYKSRGYPAMYEKWLEYARVETDEINPGYFAIIYSTLKNKEKTLYWLEEAYRERNGGVLSLKQRNYEFLREEPRYRDLLRKMNLPE